MKKRYCLFIRIIFGWPVRVNVVDSRREVEGMKTRKGNIKSNLFLLAVTPLICLGTAALIIVSISIYTAMTTETEDGLKNLAYALHYICETDGEGDFNLVEGVLQKDGENFSSDYSIVDKIKSISDVDATIFFGDTRILTSVRNSDGSRAVGTHAAAEVIKAVLEGGEDYFSSRVMVNDVPYFGCYIPLHNSDGTIVGMVFVGKARKMVMDTILHTNLKIFILIAAVGAAAGGVSMLYARRIVYSLDKTKEFLGSIARGNVEVDMDPAILNRNDEIGEMGNFAVGLKTSIDELISTDPLTGLYNRRTCEVILPNVIREYEKYNTPSVVVIGDIDFFKKVNDTYGHPGGDAVLKELSLLFREHMERKGIVARWGGEEFMFIYERMNMERVRVYLEELLESVRNAKISYNNMLIPITMTFGAAACKEGVAMDMLIRQADENLYYGKKNGRNQIVTVIDER